MGLWKNWALEKQHKLPNTHTHTHQWRNVLTVSLLRCSAMTQNTPSIPGLECTNNAARTSIHGLPWPVTYNASKNKWHLSFFLFVFLFLFLRHILIMISINSSIAISIAGLMNIIPIWRFNPWKICSSLGITKPFFVIGNKTCFKLAIRLIIWYTHWLYPTFYY